jgi:hypothetical protein
VPFTSHGKYQAIDPWGSWGQFDPFNIIGGASRRWIFGESARSRAPVVPAVIGEIPQTWEELEQSDPELFEPILETRPGLPPDPYPQPVETVTPAQSDEDEHMAHDWGHLLRQGIDAFLPTGVSDPGGMALLPPVPVGTGTVLMPTHAGGDGCDGMSWSGGTPPKGYKVVNHCGQGVLRKIRRRRRPRIATNSDLADISAIVGIVGKGQLATALISRRGR